MKFLFAALLFVALSGALLSGEPRLIELSQRSTQPPALYDATWNDDIELHDGTAHYAAHARNYLTHEAPCPWQGIITIAGQYEPLLTFSFGETLAPLSEQREQLCASFHYIDGAGNQGYINVFIRRQPADPTGIPQALVTYEFANQDINNYFCNQPYWPLVGKIVDNIVGMICFKFRPIVSL